MPKRTLSQNVERGLLTVSNVAELCGVSSGTVRKWLEKEPPLISSFKIEDSQERRISPISVQELMLKRGHPVHSKLNEAVTAFNARYNPDFSLRESA